jgi:hypothetical protein
MHENRADQAFGQVFPKNPTDNIESRNEWTADLESSAAMESGGEHECTQHPFSTRLDRSIPRHEFEDPFANKRSRRVVGKLWKTGFAVVVASNFASNFDAL